jgi:ElaB/YqjD/DUF883 family membrane-anchored ribosome-binding protein
MPTTNRKTTSNNNRNNADIADDLKKVIAEARELLEATGEEKAHNGMAALRERLDEGLETVKSELEKRRGQFDDYSERGRDEISQRPYIALGAALGVGAIIGAIFSSRR